MSTTVTDATAHDMSVLARLREVEKDITWAPAASDRLARPPEEDR